MSTELNSKLTNDMSSPGGVPEPLNIHAKSKKEGARLARSFEVAAVALVGLVVTGLVIGIVTSGNNASTKPDADSKIHQAGKTQADIGAFERISREQKEKAELEKMKGPQASLDKTEQNPDPQKKPAVGALSGGGMGNLNGPANANNAANPAFNSHQQWQAEQFYKTEEARFAASQSAKNSATFVNVSASQNPKQVTTDSPSTRPAVGATGATDDPTRLNNLAAEVARSSASSANGGAGPNGVFSQAPNTSFLSDQKKMESGYLNSTLNEPLGKFELFAGSVIPAVTTLGINSDLPGTVFAMVRQTVYDSRNENIVLIPQGTKIIGLYNSSVSYGQQRVLIAWNQLILPNGKTIDLQGMAGADSIGQSGLYDSVDNHYFRIFGSALLVSMLGVAAQLSQPQNSSLLAAPSIGSQATGSAASQFNTVGTNMVNKNLNIAPTLVIAPGFAFNVLVNKTMIMSAYK